jgi:hypothetical protein
LLYFCQINLLNCQQIWLYYRKIISKQFNLCHMLAITDYICFSKIQKSFNKDYIKYIFDKKYFCSYIFIAVKILTSTAPLFVYVGITGYTCETIKHPSHLLLCLSGFYFDCNTPLATFNFIVLLNIHQINTLNYCTDLHIEPLCVHT